MHKPTITEFIRYCAVGAVGFIVDGGILWWLTSGAIDGGVNAYFARLISFPIAVSITWILHRLWTFSGANEGEKGRQYAGYFILQVTASLMNYGIYAGVIGLYGISDIAVMMGFALGSAFGLAVNYMGAKWLVFRG
ncbi:GtrA family protein [Kordiimonas sp. SCSIO 12610]|uniref:GtrA family protein n=1 Tax=Kordiimonas sp. SCSIO 12610 TaxID=2829597 RepID=UPI002108D9B0|nr:GtrA family protein [Kordiimonas sp. SCSIO 12610]UTW56032.1 GtrA family protein [Kordiimonas sp. SCSIO 12610]